MKITLENSDFLGCFDHIGNFKLDKYGRNNLNVFSLQINANEFNYNNLVDNLIDPVIDYSLSRRIKEEYLNAPARLSRKARQKFKTACKNDGELGELLLFCFLETHLNAPKILSKLELKTSTQLYVNGADGVHFLKLENGNFQLIFGESKMYKNISDAIKKAMQSIFEFKNEINHKGDYKSGIMYEKALISDNVLKETFNEEEKEFLKALIYPNSNKAFEVDDAFGIFIGFEIDISNVDKKFPNDIFRETIHQKILESVNNNLSNFITYIDKYELQGHDFYIYVVPFTDIDKNRKELLEEVLA